MDYDAIKTWLTIKPIISKVCWFHDDDMQVYLRVVNYRNQIHLANVSVRPEMQGRGIFTVFDNWLKQTARELGYSSIKYEIVIEERFQTYFTKQGLQPVEGSPLGDAPSFVLKLENN